MSRDARRRRTGQAWWTMVLATAVLVSPGAPVLWAQPGFPQPVDRLDARPVQLEGVGLEQRLGEFVPQDVEFRDDRGQVVRLGDYFGERPVILSLAYFNCPMLCPQLLHGMTSAFRVLPFDVGREFEVITLSIDPSDTPAGAAEMKARYREDYGRPGVAEGWHFLTGEEAAIRRVADAVGFGYSYDEQTGQFAHATGIMVLTPSGQLARYFYGIEYSPRDLRFGLMEASEEQIGSPVDQLLLACFHYDPTAGKYSVLTLMLVRIGGVVTLAILATFLLVSFRRERLANRTHGA